MSPLARVSRKGEESIQHHSRLPIPFVVGAGRSGNTLLRLMLDAHPEMAIPPETFSILKAVWKERDNETLQQHFVDMVTSHRRWKVFHLDRKALERRISEIDPFSRADAIRAFYELYMEAHGKSRWGDKTPPYINKMTKIQKAFPEAHFIHLIRDGRDVALSIQGLSFGPNTIDEAADWWNINVLRAREQAPYLSHYVEVRYEDLIRDTESVLHMICEFIDLRWDRQMLDYHQTAELRLSEFVNEEQRAIHALTKRNPDSSRIENWRKQMSPEDQRSFESRAGGLLQSLGYDVSAADY